MSQVVIAEQKGPGCLVQLIWFALVGWWLGQLWIAAAWALFASVIGIPFGVMLLNKLPQIIALRQTEARLTVATAGGVTVVAAGTPQRCFLVRALYFLLIGWWFSGVWMEVAYVLCISMVGLPIGFWMFDRTPAIVSLRRG